MCIRDRSLSIFFICILSISNAILQAHGKQSLPIVSLIAGSVVKLILSFILIGIPAIGIYGAPISTVVCYMVTTGCNVYFMAKYTDVTPSVFKTFFKPLLAAVISIASAFGSFCALTGHMYDKLVTISAVAVAAIVYFIALFILRGIDESDVKMLPKGEKIYSLLHKMKLLR